MGVPFNWFRSESAFNLRPRGATNKWRLYQIVSTLFERELGVHFCAITRLNVEQRKVCSARCPVINPAISVSIWNSRHLGETAPGHAIRPGWGEALFSRRCVMGNTNCTLLQNGSLLGTYPLLKLLEVRGLLSHLVCSRTNKHSLELSERFF